MKIAIFSDIHANLPALEIFFKDIDQVNPDAIYCLGDLVGYNVWPNEVVKKIRERNIPTIMGNHEEALLKPPAKEEQLTNKGLTRSLLTEENIEYLIDLPRHLSLTFSNSWGNFNWLMVHGSPKSTTDYMVEDYPESEVLELMDQNRADLLLCGHTHKPFHSIIKSGDRYKHVINIGSVGKPKDGDRRLCYALIEFNQSLNSHNSDSLKVSFRRIEYDIEKAARAVEVSAFDNSLATALRIGK